MAGSDTAIGSSASAIDLAAILHQSGAEDTVVLTLVRFVWMEVRHRLSELRQVVRGGDPLIPKPVP